MSPITTSLSAAKAARAPVIPANASSNPNAVLLIPIVVSVVVRDLSDSKPFIEHRRLRLQLSGREFLDDLAVLHEIKPVRERQCEPEILFHHDDRVALPPQRVDQS